MGIVVKAEFSKAEEKPYVSQTVETSLTHRVARFMQAHSKLIMLMMGAVGAYCMLSRNSNTPSSTTLDPSEDPMGTCILDVCYPKPIEYGCALRPMPVVDDRATCAAPLETGTFDQCDPKVKPSAPTPVESRVSIAPTAFTFKNIGVVVSLVAIPVILFLAVPPFVKVYREFVKEYREILEREIVDGVF